MQVSKITLFGGGKRMVTLDLTFRSPFEGISTSSQFFKKETPIFVFLDLEVKFNLKQLLFQLPKRDNFALKSIFRGVARSSRFP